MSRLTTTSYALLAQLHLRPWSAYELTQRMRHSAAGTFWSRTASRLYEEPKNLVSQGLAERSVEHNGNRRRTIYRITEAGRKALRVWLSQPPAPLVTEFEGMLKINCCDAGSRAQLRANVRRIREQVVTQADSIRTLAREVADLGGAFPERAHIAALSCRFLAQLMKMQVAWAEWAESFIDAWPASGTNTELDRLSRDVLKDSLRTARELLPTAPPHGPPRPAASPSPPPPKPMAASTPADWAPWT